MNPMNINMASNDMRLQNSSFTSLNQNQYSASSTPANVTNSSTDLDFNQNGDDSMIALVLGDLDFLNLIAENDQLQQQQQQQQIQPNIYHQQQQVQVSYQAQAQMQPIQAQQQSVTSSATYDNSMGLNRGLSGVNLLDLHDEQSERIKSEVIDMNILNLMPSQNSSNYYSSTTNASSVTRSSSAANPAYLPQLSMNSTTTMLDTMSQVSSLSDQQPSGQLDPNFDFILPDKSSKEILECLINDETDMFDSLFAPRIDYINTNVNNVSSNVNPAPLRSVSSQFGDLFRLDSNDPFATATSSTTIMPKAPSKGKGKGKFLRADQSLQVTRASARLQSKRIINCTKTEPMDPVEPVLMTSTQTLSAQPTRMPGKLEAYSANMSNNSSINASYKRKRSYEDDDGSDQSNDGYPAHKHSSSREMSQMNSMDNSMDYDAENQLLLQQSSQLLAALQRQSRLTGNKRLSANMKDIERELQVLNSTKSPSVSSVASKGVPSMPLDSRRSSLHSSDYPIDDENNPLKNKDSNKDAAFRYRLKKLSEKDRLFETRELLERENGEVKRRIDLAQAEISYLKTLLVQMLLNKGYLDSSRVVS